MGQGARTDLAPDDAMSDAQAAAALSVGERSVERAKALRREAPDLHEKVKAGTMRAGKARRALQKDEAADMLESMARLKITLLLNSGARIGPGKVALLESVRDTGSISAAARAMGMDYKRAWLLVDSLNRAFASPIVERTTGGPRGGGATLTVFGEELLALYRHLQAAATTLAADDLAALERRALPDAGPKV